MKRIVFALLALMSLASLAATTARTPVATVLSHPGESLDELLIRVAAVMKAVNAESHFEICGVVAGGPTGYGVNLSTIHAHVACDNDANDVPEGMVSLGATIHIHGGRKSFLLNQVDLTILGPGHDPSIPRRGDPNTFSAGDYEAGAGWLVGEDHIYFQHGVGTAEAVLAL